MLVSRATLVCWLTFVPRGICDSAYHRLLSTVQISPPPHLLHDHGQQAGRPAAAILRSYPNNDKSRRFLCVRPWRNSKSQKGPERSGASTLKPRSEHIKNHPLRRQISNIMMCCSTGLTRALRENALSRACVAEKTDTPPREIFPIFSA